MKKIVLALIGLLMLAVVVYAAITTNLFKGSSPDAASLPSPSSTQEVELVRSDDPSLLAELGEPACVSEHTSGTRTVIVHSAWVSKELPAELPPPQAFHSENTMEKDGTLTGNYSYIIIEATEVLSEDSISMLTSYAVYASNKKEGFIGVAGSATYSENQDKKDQTDYFHFPLQTDVPHTFTVAYIILDEDLQLYDDFYYRVGSYNIWETDGDIDLLYPESCMLIHLELD
ncbi:MAG: hypothetical protein ACOX88_06575 [Christensenellales bacterium]|jgi:hypothetical protein